MAIRSLELARKVDAMLTTCNRRYVRAINDYSRTGSRAKFIRARFYYNQQTQRINALLSLLK